MKASKLGLWFASIYLSIAISIIFFGQSLDFKGMYVFNQIAAAPSLIFVTFLGLSQFSVDNPWFNSVFTQVALSALIIYVVVWTAVSIVRVASTSHPSRSVWCARNVGVGLLVVLPTVSLLRSEILHFYGSTLGYQSSNPTSQTKYCSVSDFYPGMPLTEVERICGKPLFSNGRQNYYALKDRNKSSFLVATVGKYVVETVEESTRN